jgi:hypothetical protein
LTIILANGALAIDERLLFHRVSRGDRALRSSAVLLVQSPLMVYNQSIPYALAFVRVPCASPHAAAARLQRRLNLRRRLRKRNFNRKRQGSCIIVCAYSQALAGLYIHCRVISV